MYKFFWLFCIGCALAVPQRRPVGRRRPLQQQQQRRPAYDYYEYYDDYYAEEEQPKKEVGKKDYDLAELVKAWKDYIKEKKEAEPTPKPIEEYECPPRDDSYRIPDSVQCDKFSECNIKGELTELLCPDGLVFDIKAEHCDYMSKVNCTGRPELQEAQVSKNCPRANGFFPFPANESCQKFYDCRGGTGYLQECPNGVIFDPFIDACTTPDQSNREECQANKVLGFECPKFGPDDVLRFGNHERLPNPKNCQEYFSCNKNGSPRLGACPKNTVFSNATAQCAEPATVPGCETFWKDKEEEEEEKEAYYYDG